MTATRPKGPDRGRVQCRNGSDRCPWHSHRGAGANRLARERASETVCRQMGITPRETSTAMFGTEIVLKHQVSEARFQDFLAEAERQRLVIHRPRWATASATSRHLGGASVGSHTAPPRGLLADAGRGAGCVQWSRRLRAADRSVNAAIAGPLVRRGVADAGDASPRRRKPGARVTRRQGAEPCPGRAIRPGHRLADDR